jgi:hypothetical protein
MTNSLRNPECRDVDELLEAYADGDLSIPDVAMVEKHLASCETCAQQLTLVRSVASSLEQLPAVTAPETLRESVFANRETVGVVESISRKMDSAGRFMGRHLRRPLVDFALITAVVALVAVPSWFTTSNGEYSEEEIAQAREQAEMVLAYVGQTLRDVSKRTTTEFIPEYVTKPLQRPFDVISQNVSKGE